MVTLMSRHQSRRERRQGKTDDTGASASATSWFPTGPALGVAGLATASTAITCLAISQSPSSSTPPPALQQGNDDVCSSGCYLLAVSGIFYAGIAELGAAVWVMAEPRGRRVATGRRLVHASLVPLTAAVGLLAEAMLLW